MTDSNPDLHGKVAFITGSARRIFRCVPLLDDHVYQIVEFENPLELPLLAGPVRAYRGGDYVVTAPLMTTPPGKAPFPTPGKTPAPGTAPTNPAAVSGASREKRLHGAYVTESEIKLVVEFLKKTSSVQQKESIFKTFQSKSTQQIDSDPLFNEAVEIVVTSGQASISMLQRRLRVGHSRAARLIDMMEQEGFVGPFEGSKPREILIQKEELESILNGVNT